MYFLVTEEGHFANLLTGVLWHATGMRQSQSHSKADDTQVHSGSSHPDFSDCKLCAASATEDAADKAVAAEAARHLLVTGVLRQYYAAQGTCPAGVAQELFRLLSSSSDQQVGGVVSLLVW